MGMDQAAIWKKAGLILSVLLAANALSAATAPPVEAPKESLTMHISPKDPRILYMGRLVLSDSEAKMGFPGVTIRFTYRGPAPTVLFNTTSPNCAFNLTCNGWDPVAIFLKDGRNDLLLPSGTAPASGWVVELARRNEAWHGICGFLGLELPKGCELLPPRPFPTRKLLVIGDSITCGEKIDRMPPEFSSSYHTWNAPRSYGMLLGRWLNAQTTLLSCGGRGLMRDWLGKSDTSTAPQFFQRALPDDPQAVWDHASYIPDAVVITLGTNDLSSSLPEMDGFISAYMAFLDEIRKVYPKAAIILAESPIFGEEPGSYDRVKRDFLRTCLDTVVTRRKLAGDTKVAVGPLRKYPGTATDAHPVAFQHEQIALELLPVVKQLTGW
jgi:lysophospholipase L1-like esterase